MIYIECNADYALVRSLIRVARKDVIHEFKGKFEVCKRLENQRNCKGLIDEDPTSIQPPYLKHLQRQDEFSEHDLILLHDRNSSNYLIVLCPRLEEWVLKSAREASMDVRKYDLPNDARALHRHARINPDKLENLLEDLKSSSQRLKTLKRLLERD